MRLFQCRFVQSDRMPCFKFDCEMPEIRIANEKVFLGSLGKPGPIHEILGKKAGSGIEVVVAHRSVDAEERDSIFREAIYLAQNIDESFGRLSMQLLLNGFGESPEFFLIGAGQEWKESL